MRLFRDFFLTLNILFLTVSSLCLMSDWLMNTELYTITTTKITIKIYGVFSFPGPVSCILNRLCHLLLTLTI